MRRPFIYSRGLAAGESSDRAEPVQIRKNNSQIPVAQWPESKQSFFMPKGMRDVSLEVRKDAVERSHTFIIS